MAAVIFLIDDAGNIILIFMKWTDEKIEELKRLYESGLLPKEIAAHFNITLTATHQARSKFVPTISELKLSGVELQQVIDGYCRGNSIQKLASKFNVSNGFIRRRLKKNSDIRPKKVLLDLIGKTFGFLKVVSYAGFRNGKAFWLCECVCGNETIVASQNLRSINFASRTNSCGCQQYVVRNFEPFVWTSQYLNFLMNSESDSCLYPLCESSLVKYKSNRNKWHLCRKHNKLRAMTFRRYRNERSNYLEKHL